MTIFCNYFNGMKNGECEKGIKYSSLGANDEVKYPCVISARDTKETVMAECEHCEYPNKEEINKNNAGINNLLGNICKARKAITDHMRYETGCGGIKCPICENGRLEFYISSNNGHIHAKCTTDNCIAWME